MYAIILAGGSGTRLWPLSRELFPKQYLSLPIPGLSGGGVASSLFQATVARVTATVEPDKVIVVTHNDQMVEIRRQLSQLGIEGVRLLAEPEARNTAPAIGLAATLLLGEAGPDAVMAVLPSDHLIPDSEAFSALLAKGAAAAAEYGLVTFGIRPTYPETGYGYICCGEELKHTACRVEKFVEKPDLETAKTYLADSRYLWNSGMFVFQVGALAENYRRLLPGMFETLERVNFENFDNLPTIYGSLEKISIDYGILERASAVTVIPTSITWSDLGSWEAFYQLSDKDERGNSFSGPVIAVNCEDSMILSNSRLVGAAGLKDLVIVETADALLVCDRHRTQDVKKIVDVLKEKDAAEAREHKTVYRPWGSYTSLELGSNYQVKRINVNPGARLSLQSHRRRAENWVVVEGEALVTVDDRQIVVKKGESAYIPKGARHRMENRGSVEMVLIEVQNGDYLGEDDIERYEDDYGRTDDTIGSSNETAASGTESMDEQNISSSSDGGEKTISPSPLEGEGRGEGAVSPAQTQFERWLNYSKLDEPMRAELKAMQNDPSAIESHFGRELSFGTGGMRDIIGPGLNRINCYTIRRATQGLANHLNSLPASGSSEKPKQVAIAFDTRLNSEEFAEATALVLAANGIKALLFEGIRPTPVLSYATRELGCAAGIVVTASHNPPQYNGYKIYGPDGGQAVSPLVDDVIAAINKVDIFDDVKTLNREEALHKGLFEMIDPALERSYLGKIRALSLSSPQVCQKVVFTPLHGTGMVYIPDLLSQSACIDLIPVEAQMIADPQFSTVRVPNPEDPAALDMALDKARQSGAELVLATDPDGDRVGTAVRDKSGDFVILNGNQVGALLLEYICSRLSEKEAMPPNPVLVKTIVTGDLGRRVAESYGLQTIETLTGFKFIGEQIKVFKDKGTPDFIFGYEESCGYLTGTFVRDKDAVITSFIIAEMSAYYKEQGRNLLEVLEELQQRHGYHREDLLTVELKDITEADQHVAAFDNLPPDLAGQKVIEKRDYDQGRGWNYHTDREFALNLPRSRVLHFTLADGSWFAVRPSGTEPKVKFYLAAKAPTAAEAEQKLAGLREAVLSRA